MTDEDEFDIIEKKEQIPFVREFTYKKEFNHGDLDPEYIATVDEFKKEIEERWFYTAEANINENDSEGYENFINWTRMVIEIHDMSDEQFIDKIIYGNSDYPSIEDCGYKITGDNLDDLRYEVMLHLLEEAKTYTYPDGSIYQLAVTLNSLANIINSSYSSLLEFFYENADENAVLNVDSYLKAIENNNNRLEEVYDVHYKVIEKFDDIKVEYWDDYKHINSKCSLEEYRQKIILDYLDFIDNNLTYEMDKLDKTNSTGWINNILSLIKEDQEQFIDTIKEKKHYADNYIFNHLSNSNLDKVKSAIINGTTYLTSKMLYDADTPELQEEHNKEIENFNVFINENLKNYKCYIIPKYTDLGHKNKIIEGYTDNLHEAFENIYNKADIHSGIDLKFNDEGDIVLVCYGNMYNYVPDSVTLEKITEYTIISVNDRNERINLYEEIFGKEKENTLEEYQTQEDDMQDL